MHAKQSLLRNSIQSVGAVKKGVTTKTGEKGEIWEMNTPSGPMDVRIMEGVPGAGRNYGPRTITTRSNTNDYVYPHGERITGAIPKSDRRAIGHIHEQSQ